MKRYLASGLLAIGVIASSVGAEQPGWIRYQGRLVENGALANRSNVQITFFLYNQASGGTLLYQETDAVTASEGFYATDLGDNPHAGSPDADFARALATAGTNAWLALRVDAGPELQPRERLGGAPFAVNARGLRRVLTVGPGGVHATIGAALAAIIDNNATNGYLVKVSPGVFAERVTMKPFVDIEGCGRGVTTIAYASTNASGEDAAVLGASNTEMRCLSLSVQGTGGTLYGYRASGSRSSALSDVAVSMSIPSGVGGRAVFAEMFSSLTLCDVDVTVTGGSAATYGITLATGSPGTFRGVRVVVSGAQGCTAISCSESSVDMENVGIYLSGIAGSASGISASGGVTARGLSMMVRSSGPATGISESEGTLVLRQASLDVWGAGAVRGIGLLGGAEGTVADAHLLIRGGNPNEGAVLTGGAELTWTGGRLNASGAAAATNVGVRCSNASTFQLQGVAMHLATGGAAAEGVVLEFASGTGRTNRIDQCVVNSPGTAIRADGSLYVTFCGASLLQGGLSRSAGTLRTVHCYDGAATAIPDVAH